MPALPLTPSASHPRPQSNGDVAIRWHAIVRRIEILPIQAPETAPSRVRALCWFHPQVKRHLGLGPISPKLTSVTLT